MMNFAAAVSMNLVSARAPRERRSVRAFAACAALALGALGALSCAPAAAQGVYYQCPGNVFTNTISAKEAETKGCKSREAVQVTTIPAPRPHAVAAPGGTASRVDAQEQKARDNDSRRILEDELRKSEAQLDALKKEYNNGEPERQGNEKNYQKYLDRVAEMRSAIERKQIDIAALRREIQKLPPPAAQ
jgi:hypothetical protein